MAIYHFSGQILGRGQCSIDGGGTRRGANVVAAAAYRAGGRLTDGRNNQVYDYSRRKGVVHAEILRPEGSAAWLSDRERLWTAVEAGEVRRDAQLAREFNMALPHELDAEQRLRLVRDFVSAQFVRLGMVADIALHDPVPEQGQSPLNFHAHVMLSLRMATPTGLHPVKTRAWNSRGLLASWRAAWSDACNSALERAHRRERIDHRTLFEQRAEALRHHDVVRMAELDRQPEVHVGPRARQMMRQGRIPVSRVRRTRQREIAYPRIDHGPRLAYVKSRIASSNERTRMRLEAIARRADRMRSTIDRWEGRADAFGMSADIGRKFRLSDRGGMGLAGHPHSASGRSGKVAHARKRINQLRDIFLLVQILSRTHRRRFEIGLIRERQVTAWTRQSLCRPRVERTR